MRKKVLEEFEKIKFVKEQKEKDISTILKTSLKRT